MLQQKLLALCRHVEVIYAAFILIIEITGSSMIIWTRIPTSI